jgi:hypothetical protein
MQSGIFPIKEFETWDTMPNKMYPGLKTFIHEAFTRRLTTISLGNTAGSLGYVGNNANAFAVINSMAGEETDDDDATTVMQAAAAATTRSTLGKHSYNNWHIGIIPSRGVSSNPTARCKSNGHNAAICSIHGQQSTPAYTPQRTGAPSNQYQHPTATV